MKDQFNNIWDATKAFWSKQSKKMKIVIGGVGGVILMLAIIVTATLNLQSAGYKVLYPNLSGTETAEVYATLQEMGVAPKVNGAGEVMVPSKQWDDLMLTLSSKGYPKSAPPYGIYLDNAGITTTETDKKQALRFQLQDRMQETLSRITGVESAVVTIDTPQKSDYVWDTNTQSSTASVVVRMTSGYTLSPERVSAIQNILSASVAGMLPTSVKVIDAATGVEMDSTTPAEGGVDFKRLEYEKLIQKQIEDNIKRLLAPKYGPDGVIAVAKVTLDYDKTVIENNEKVPTKDGAGIKTHDERDFALSSEVALGGIAGEQNNTDTPAAAGDATTPLPGYANALPGDGTTGVTKYRDSNDYESSYVLTQIEKGQAVLKSATVAVVVNDANFDTQKQELLTDLISKSVNVDKTSISVSNLDFTNTEVTTGTTPGGLPFGLTPTVLIIAGAGLLALLLVIISIIIAMRRRAKRRAEEEDAESENQLKSLQKEIEAHKQTLKDNAMDANNKENAIVNEVRDFAKTNPEITASLIRTMLKEDE